MRSRGKRQPRREAAFCVEVNNARGHTFDRRYINVALSHISDLVNPDIALSVNSTQKYFLSELWGLTDSEKKTRNLQYCGK